MSVLYRHFCLSVGCFVYWDMTWDEMERWKEMKRDEEMERDEVLKMAEELKMNEELERAEELERLRNHVDLQEGFLYNYI